jgi:hypothetical protein
VSFTAKMADHIAQLRPDHSSSLAPDLVKSAGADPHRYNPMDRESMPANDLLAAPGLSKFLESRGIAVDARRAGAADVDLAKAVGLQTADLGSAQRVGRGPGEDDAARSDVLYPDGAAREQQAYVAEVQRLLPMQEQMRTLDEAAQAGKISHLGVLQTLADDPRYTNAFRERMRTAVQQKMALAKSTITHPRGGRGGAWRG